MELSISKLPTPPSFNPQVSAPLCLLGFPTVPESEAPPLFAHQGAAPVIPCPALCLRLELSLDAPPQETIQSPPFKQVIKSTLSHLGPCLSLELCLGVPPPVTFPHPTFVLTWVPQQRAGHLVTLSALVPSSQECGFTHTKPFSNFNKPDQTPPKWQKNDLVSGGHGPAWPSWELAWTMNWVDWLRTSADKRM